MGVISNIYLLSVCILILPYGTVFADKFCYKGMFEDHYECPDDTWCCDVDRCCSFSSYTSGYSAFYSFLTTALIAFAIISCCCLVCSCCCRRRQNGVVYSTGTSTVVQLPPHSLPQGYPGYPPAQPPYPTNQGGYNPYYGVPPPEYQATVPTPVSNPHIVPVVPVASAPPAN